MNIYSLFYQPYLDSYQQCYKNIITINLFPNGPLQKLVKKIHFNKLSCFQESSNSCNKIENCGYALVSPYNLCSLLTVDDIPDLFSYLLSNGYTIDYQTTKLLQKNNMTFNTNSDKQLLCFITYTK